MDSNKSKKEQSYLSTLKMAIAFACIKTKPENMTAREYTEEICQNYLHRHQTCKDKLKAAENEILQLKQQLVLKSSLPTDRSTDHTEMDCSNNAIRASTTDTEMPTDRDHHINQNTDLAAPNSHMIQNTAFLQSILNLQTVTRTPMVSSVTLSTIKNSLTMIKLCIEQEEAIVSLQKNVNIVMAVLDCEQYVDLVQVVDSVMDIIKCMLNMLLSKEHSSMKEPECLVNLITSFCHRKLFEKVVKMILTILMEFSEHLRSVRLKREIIHIIQYWNTNYIFLLFKTIVQKHREHSLMMSSDFVDNLNENLDQTLLHLTDPFPLFAHAIWNVQGILQQILLGSQPPK